MHEPISLFMLLKHSNESPYTEHFPQVDKLSKKIQHALNETLKADKELNR